MKACYTIDGSRITFCFRIIFPDLWPSTNFLIMILGKSNVIIYIYIDFMLYLCTKLRKQKISTFFMLSWEDFEEDLHNCNLWILHRLKKHYTVENCYHLHFVFFTSDWRNSFFSKCEISFTKYFHYASYFT